MFAFVDALENHIGVSDEFDLNAMKIDAYIESVVSELDINMKRSELKVMKESGSYDDLTELYEAAEDGAIAKVKDAIKAVINAFMKFITDLKDKVVRVIVTKTTRDTLNKVEKRVRVNPFVNKKKVQITDKKKALKVINQYKSKCDSDIAKVKAGIFKQSDVDSIFKHKDDFEHDYKKAIAGTAAVTTITVGALIKQINSDLTELPNIVTKVGKETSESIDKLIGSMDDEEAIASTRAAYTAAANLRAKIGKAEANEYVDSIMEAIRILKKKVGKIQGSVEVDITKESTYDDDMFEESTSEVDALLSELEDLY